MIPIPQQAVRGQVLTADMINAIHRTLRRLRPIAGANVHLQECDAGVIISAGASTTASRASESFDYRFKVTATQEQKAVEGSEETATQWLLTIRHGSLFEVSDPTATEKPFAMLEGVTKLDAGGWKVEDASAGSLFIARMTKGEDKTAAEAAKNDGSNPTDLTDTTGAGESSSQESDTTLTDEEAAEIGVGYKLCFGSDTSKALFVIADFYPASSTPIDQRVLGDVYFFPAPSAVSTGSESAAWRVRFDEESQQWQIFYPLWVKGQDQLLAEGYSAGWTALAATLQAEGTLYATLHWLGTKDEDSGTVSWTLDPATPQLINTLKDVPADCDPSGSGSSATQGHKTIVVTIGTFTTSSTVAGDASESEKLKALSFEQVHEGAIVETFTPAPSTTASALPDGLTLYGEVSYDEATATLTQAILKWSQAKNAFVSAGSKTILAFERESLSFVSEVALGTQEDASSSSSGSIDVLSATKKTIERWVLKTGSEDTTSSATLLTFAPHEADEKTPYGSEDAP